MCYVDIVENNRYTLSRNPPARAAFILRAAFVLR